MLPIPVILRAKRLKVVPETITVLALLALLSGCETVRHHEIIPATENGDDVTPPAKLTAAELDYIGTRRAVVGLPAPGRDSPVVGLTASGGGLRSSIVTVGVFQGLQEIRLERDDVTALERMDYLSAVSGGSYTSSWLVGHCLPNPAYALHSRVSKAPFSYDALDDALNAVGEDGAVSAQSLALRRELGAAETGRLAPRTPREWRRHFKALGFCEQGFRNSSSYIGDLLENRENMNPDSNDNDEPFMRLRSQAPRNGVTVWSNAPHVMGWAVRYPAHLVTTLLLNWSPTDKFNDYRLTSMFADLLKRDYFVPDANRVVCVPPKEGGAGMSEECERFFRKIPQPTGMRDIALADMNPDGSEAPYLIIGACLINTAGKLDSPESPPCGHFEFASRWTGGERPGYVATPGFGRYIVSCEGNVLTTADDPKLFGFIPLGEGKPFLTADAVAASAAASDGAAMPEIGALGSYILNTDLRHTDRNFNQFTTDGWLGGTPGRFANFLRETTVERFDNCKNVTSGSLYFIDGGYFENTGAFALLRRGVPLITVIDATYDPDCDWDDFHQFVGIVHRLGFRMMFDGPEGARLRSALMHAAADPIDDVPREKPLACPPEALVYRMRLIPPAGSGRPPTTLIVGKMSYEGLSACASIPPEKRRMLADYRKFDPGFPHKPSAEITSNVHEWECLRLVGKYMGLELGRALDAELRHPERPILTVAAKPADRTATPLFSR